MNAQGGYFVRFPTPIQASANNTAIVVNVPTFGAMAQRMAEDLNLTGEPHREGPQCQ
jgi:hypothetical protein